MSTSPPEPPQSAGAEDLTLLRVRADQLADRVLVVGDPRRAQRIADRLDDATQVGSNREYDTYTGTHNGVPVSVASHGVGAAGAAVAFDELCRGGAQRIIRCGTAGGLQPGVVDGLIVIATGAVRNDGVTSGLVPIEYPAIADATIVHDLGAAATAAGIAVHTGIVLTSDVFYSLPILGSNLDTWHRAGCVAVEMEVSALLVIASQYRVAAGAVLAIDGNPLAANDTDMSDYQPFREVVDQAVDAAFSIALDALIGDHTTERGPT